MSRIEEIRARLSAATPGPWRTQRADEESGEIDWEVMSGAKGTPVARVSEADDYGLPTTRGDAALIAAAPADLAYLLAELERVEGERDAAVARVTYLESYQHTAEALLSGASEDRDSAVAAERERCARVCDEKAAWHGKLRDSALRAGEGIFADVHGNAVGYLLDCAAVIRRGGK